MRLLYGNVMLLLLVIFTASRRIYSYGNLPNEGDSSKDVRHNCSTRMLTRLKPQKLNLFQLHSLKAIVEDGIEMALRHCQNQFIDRRWNCSGLSVAKVLERQGIMKADIRQSAFVSAITAAAVSYKIAETCARGKWDKCGCRPGRNQTATNFWNLWKWHGCIKIDELIKYGEEVSRWYLDPKPLKHDVHSLLIRHNSEAGRKALKSAILLNCKYFSSGFSGYRLCWRELGPFTRVAGLLRERFDRSLRVRVNKTLLRMESTLYKRPPPTIDLIYVDDSPSFCEADLTLGTPGSRGRLCKKFSYTSADCTILCCARGFTTVKRSGVKRKCNCKFIWCCKVQCEQCKKDVIEHRCK